MTEPTANSITQLLATVGCGDASASRELPSADREEFDTPAPGQMANGDFVRTQRPSLLVHETYLLLKAGDITQSANQRFYIADTGRTAHHIPSMPHGTEAASSRRVERRWRPQVMGRRFQAMIEARCVSSTRP